MKDNFNAVNRQKFVTARTKYNKIKRVAKYKYKLQEGENICKTAKTQTKKFWKSIKDKFKTKPRHSERLTANDLLNHFEHIYGGDANTPPQQHEQFRFDETEPIINPELDSEITDNELRNGIFHQKNNKSPGMDNLIAETFKISYDIISRFLLKLYNRLFLNGDYLRAWGDGFIVPIFKGGDKDDAQNYRGITLINILSKVYSQILLNRLTPWSDRENKLSSNQFGFQKGKSTVDCIFIFSSIISKTLNAGCKLYCVFLDYEKEFDKIDRSFLWHKLISENVSSKLVKTLKSMYTTVKSCIRYRSTISGFFDLHIGLKQGDPSSPLMFTLFINDIIGNINSNFLHNFTIDEMKIFMILYADDAIVFANTPDVLQSMLNDIDTYCTAWGLK